MASAEINRYSKPNNSIGWMTPGQGCSMLGIPFVLRDRKSVV